MAEHVWAGLVDQFADVPAMERRWEDPFRRLSRMFQLVGRKRLDGNRHG